MVNGSNAFSGVLPGIGEGAYPPHRLLRNYWKRMASTGEVVAVLQTVCRTRSAYPPSCVNNGCNDHMPRASANKREWRGKVGGFPASLDTDSRVGLAQRP